MFYNKIFDLFKNKTVQLAWPKNIVFKIDGWLIF